MTGRVQERHRGFRAVLSALAHPGRWFPVGPAGRDDALAVLVEAIWGASQGSDALVVVPPGELTPTVLAAVPRGSEERPEDGATVVCRTDAAVTTTVRLSGPGVDGQLVTRLPVAPEALLARSTACRDWPLGIDLVLIDEAGRVAGLPRSTVVEVIA